MVMSSALEDDNMRLAPAVDPISGAFNKMTKKKLGMPMPWDSESLRQRFKTMGICFCDLRSSYPNRCGLGSITIWR